MRWSGMSSNLSSQFKYIIISSIYYVFIWRILQSLQTHKVHIPLMETVFLRLRPLTSIFYHQINRIGQLHNDHHNTSILSLALMRNPFSGNGSYINSWLWRPSKANIVSSFFIWIPGVSWAYHDILPASSTIVYNPWCTSNGNEALKMSDEKAIRERASPPPASPLSLSLTI